MIILTHGSRAGDSDLAEAMLADRCPSTVHAFMFRSPALSVSSQVGPAASRMTVWLTTTMTCGVSRSALHES